MTCARQPTADDRARYAAAAAAADDPNGVMDRATVSFSAVEAAVAQTHRAQELATTRLRERVEIAADRHLNAAAAALDRALATLDAADPARVLARGYAMVADVDGRVLTSAAAAQAASTPLTLIFADGNIAVRLTEPQPSIGNQQ